MKKISLGQKDIVHFVGIGGIGMSGLAQIMKNMGFKVQGSDQTKNKIWSDLQKLSSDAHKINILDLFKSQKNRAQTMSAKSEGIFFDFSKHLITPEILNTLLAFADSIDLKDKIDDMFDGKPINKSENRAVLHTALRADQNKEHTPEVANKFQDINHQSQKIKIFSDILKIK